MSQTSEMTRPKTGEVSWNELVTKDTKGAANFYGKLFGWQSTPFTPQGMPPGGQPYNLFKMDPHSMGVGGMMQVPHPEMSSQWIPYIAVDNIDDSFAKATKLGAKTCVAVMSIGEIGRIAIIQDPQGATIGLHECPKE
jgi:predicted enzyme related to lactoylglutathione lyase